MARDEEEGEQPAERNPILRRIHTGQAQPGHTLHGMASEKEEVAQRQEGSTGETLLQVQRTPHPRARSELLGLRRKMAATKTRSRHSQKYSTLHKENQGPVDYTHEKTALKVPRGRRGSSQSHLQDRQATTNETRRVLPAFGSCFAADTKSTVRNWTFKNDSDVRSEEAKL